MTIFIDRNFLLNNSFRLEGFHKVKDDLWNFRCPFCGDSKKNKRKMRGFVYRKKNSLFYKCHNCPVSTNFYGLLEKINAVELKEYAYEKFKSSHTNQSNIPKPTFEEHKTDIVEKMSKMIPNAVRLSSLPDDHPTKAYVIGRKIPVQHHDILYHTDGFKEMGDALGVPKELPLNEPRLIIPLYDANGDLAYVQGRSLKADSGRLRYVTLKLPTTTTPKCFGIERLDKTKRIYVFEGPIDSLFIPNSVATADSSLHTIHQYLVDSGCTKDIVFVYDNQPRNKDLCAIIEKTIKLGYIVSICDLGEKDVNDCIIAGMTSDQIKSIIDSNANSGAAAQLKFNYWKKV